MIALATLISAYIVVAYFAGKNMSRSQAGIVTFLFLWFSLLVAWSTHLSLVTVLQMYIDAPAEYGLGPAIEITRVNLVVLDVGASMAIFASLKFMWDVRH